MVEGGSSSSASLLERCLVAPPVVSSSSMLSLVMKGQYSVFRLPWRKASSICPRSNPSLAPRMVLANMKRTTQTITRSIAAVAIEEVDELGPSPMDHSVLRFLKEHRSSTIREGEASYSLAMLTVDDLYAFGGVVRV
nr:hypothetical protein CFP56_25412 [Quercus suber]